MTFKDVNDEAIRAALPRLGREFRTRDLSDDPEVRAAHPQRDDANYHSIIGRYLSERVSEVQLIEQGPAPLGARWKQLSP